jgi:CRISPR/Cas system-associated exonuclease Cas4 (RecB family)
MTQICGAETPSGPCVLPRHSRGYHDPAPPTLIVPRNAAGHPQVSISQLRRYGAVDLASGAEDATEIVRGCPRAYALTYGHGQVPELPGRPAEMGTLLHRALHWMEEHACGPEEALGAVWPPTLGVLDYGDAERILTGYLERGGPLTRYATLAVELDITAELYVDAIYGPVDFRGIIDNLSVDTEDPGVLRVIDYKSAARPVSKESLRGDVQLMGYAWLVRKWWITQHGQAPDRIIAHLDLLRYGDVAIEYTAAELDLWEAWAAAMVRTMLRDTQPRPILNDGCTWCPVRAQCPAWQALPGEGATVLARLQAATPEQLGDRYTESALVLKLLAVRVKDHQAALEAETHQVGTLRVGDQDWTSDIGTKTVADVISLVDLLLPGYQAAFQVAVSASKTSVEKAAQGLPPDLALQVQGCVSTVKAGQKVKKTKVKKGAK